LAAIGPHTGERFDGGRWRQSAKKYAIASSGPQPWVWAALSRITSAIHFQDARDDRLAVLRITRTCERPLVADLLDEFAEGGPSW